MSRSVKSLRNMYTNIYIYIQYIYKNQIFCLKKKDRKSKKFVSHWKSDDGWLNADWKPIAGPSKLIIVLHWSIYMDQFVGWWFFSGGTTWACSFFVALPIWWNLMSNWVQYVRNCILHPKKLISSIIYKSAVNKWLQALFVGSSKSQVSFSRVEKKLQLNHSEFGWLCSGSFVEGNFLRIVGISRKDPRDKFTETDPIVVIPRHRFLLMTKCRWEKQETERFMRR